MSERRDVYIHDGNGNPISTYYDARTNEYVLNTHVADVHSFPVNEYFHMHTGVSTTLATDVTAGDYSITVVDSTGIVATNNIQIENGVIESTFPKVVSVVGNVLNLDRPLDHDFLIGDNVEVVSFNMAVDGSVTPVAFRLIPDRDQVWHIVRFLFSMTHGTAGDLGLFGDLQQLTYPVILRAYNGTTGEYRTFTTWDTNGQIKDDMFDVVFDQRSGGQGSYGTSGRGSIKLGTGAVPKLDGSKGDYLEILIQADLTGLDNYRQKAQGHIEGI